MEITLKLACESIVVIVALVCLVVSCCKIWMLKSVNAELARLIRRDWAAETFTYVVALVYATARLYGVLQHWPFYVPAAITTVMCTVNVITSLHCFQYLYRVKYGSLDHKHTSSDH